MSKETGGPAFPNTVKVTDEHYADLRGMTLRDYFAAKALPTILSFVHNSKDAKKIASVSYQVADAMHAERSK